jgi:hypothetical protein
MVLNSSVSFLTCLKYHHSARLKIYTVEFTVKVKNRTNARNWRKNTAVSLQKHFSVSTKTLQCFLNSLSSLRESPCGAQNLTQRPKIGYLPQRNLIIWHIKFSYFSFFIFNFSVLMGVERGLILLTSVSPRLCVLKY